MSKVLKCRDVGVDCDYEARGKTEEEVLQKAKKHAMRDHDIEEVTPDYIESWRKAIQDE